MNSAMPTYAATPMMPNMMSGVAQMPMMPPMPCISFFFLPALTIVSDKYNIYGLALEITVLTPCCSNTVEKNISAFSFKAHLDQLCQILTDKTLIHLK